MPTYTSYIENALKLNYKKLEIIKFGTLNEKSEKIKENISNFNIELKEHQKSLIFAALQLEKSSHTPCSPTNEINYQTNIGIIGDKVGSGKSIGILGLISLKPTLEEYIFPNEYIVQEGWGIISFIKQSNKKIINSNIILVPHTIINQWEKYILKFTKLSYLKINTTKSCNISCENLEKATIVLVSNNFFPNFVNHLELLYDKKQFIFDRFIIDEADNIKFGVNISVKSKFTWFITSSIENLLFPSGCYCVKKNYSHINFNNNIDLNNNMEDEHSEHIYIDSEIKYIHNKGLNFKNFIRNLFEKISNSTTDIIPIMKSIFLKHNDNYIVDCFNLPNINYFIYKCLTPYNIGFLENISNSDYINNIKTELMIYINANDISILKEKLGFKVESSENISIMITSNLRKNLENEQKHYNYIQSLDIEQSDKIERLLKISNKITDLENSINHVLERVDIDRNKICPICCDNLSKPICSVNCCHRLFCLSCITKYFNTKPNKVGDCPFCRKIIGYEGITIMDNSVIKENTDKNNLLSKEDRLIALITKNKEKKWLLFSEFDATFNTLLEKLSLSGISFSKICGTVSHIDNVINNFNNGLINVLLLNALNFGMGLNLEMATDVLIYHKLSNEIEKQVIGRAQRPGRMNQLNVHFLCHNNELEYYKNTQINNTNVIIIEQ